MNIEEWPALIVGAFLIGLGMLLTVLPYIFIALGCIYLLKLLGVI